MAIKHDVTRDDEVFSGEDKDLDFTCVQADNVTRQSIAGWLLSWYLKRAKTDPDSAAIVVATVGSGLTITNGSQGECTVRLDAEVTRDLSGTLYHELKRIENNEESVLSYGSFYIHKALHRTAP